MSKGIIAGNLGEGRYSVTLKPDEEAGQTQIEDINKQLEELESSEKIDHDLTDMWAEQSSILTAAIAEYESALSDNIDAWRQMQELDNEIGYITAEISQLQPQVADALQAKDDAEQTMLDAFTAYNNEEITWESYQATVEVYQSLSAIWSSLDLQLQALQADLTDATNERNSIVTADTAGPLTSINDATQQLLAIAEQDSIPMYEDHYDYAVDAVHDLQDAADTTIKFYNDVIETNQENSERALEIEEELLAVGEDISQLEADLPIKKSHMDSSIDAFNDAKALYDAGEMSWVEFVQYQNAMEAAIADYNLTAAELEAKELDRDQLEGEALTLTHVDPTPIFDDINSLTETGLYAAQQRDKIHLNLDRLNLRKESLEKRKSTINEILDTQEKTAELWCADYSDELPVESEVGLIEIAGLPAQTPNQIIYPAYNDEAGYDSARDGMIENVKVQTPAQAVYNWAMLPAWQKWISRYRLATIDAINTDGTCNLVIDACYSTAQNINVNQMAIFEDVPVEYMSCDAAAFDIGDHVVVVFDQDQEIEIADGFQPIKIPDWSQPKVIGFRDHPKPCPNVLLIRLHPSLSYGLPDYVTLWDLSLGQPLEVNYPGTEIPVIWPCAKSDVQAIIDDYESTGSFGFQSIQYQGTESYGDKMTMTTEEHLQYYDAIEASKDGITDHCCSEYTKAVGAWSWEDDEPSGHGMEGPLYNSTERDWDWSCEYLTEYDYCNNISYTNIANIYPCIDFSVWFGWLCYMGWFLFNQVNVDDDEFYQTLPTKPAHLGDNNDQMRMFPSALYTMVPDLQLSAMTLPVNTSLYHTQNISLRNVYGEAYESLHRDNFLFSASNPLGTRVIAEVEWPNTPSGGGACLGDERYEENYARGKEYIADGNSSRGMVYTEHCVVQIYVYEFVKMKFDEYICHHPDFQGYQREFTLIDSERIITVMAAAETSKDEFSIDPLDMVADGALEDAVTGLIEGFYSANGLTPENYCVPYTLYLDILG